MPNKHTQHIQDDPRHFEILNGERQNSIDLADRMLALNVELSEKRQRFHRRLKENLGIEKITNSLERFEELEFGELCVELAKQKRLLSLREQDAWGKYFERCKTECRSLSAQIASLDQTVECV